MSRRVRQERAEDPGVQRAWAEQRVPNPTGPHPAGPAELKDAAGGQANDGLKGRGDGAAAIAMTSQGAVGVWKIGDTDHQAPSTGVYGTPQPCAAFSVGEGVCCSLLLISNGSASLSTHEKGVLREVSAIFRAVNWLFGAASDFMASYSLGESHRYAELLSRFFLVVTGFRLL